MDSRIIEKKLELLQALAAERVLPITGWQARTADFLAPGDYRYDGDWADVALPGRFPAGKTVCLRATVTVPGDTPLADCYLVVACQAMEGLLSVDGVPYAGLDDNHRRVLVPRAGELALACEFIARPEVYFLPGVAGEAGTFLGASLTSVNRAVEALCHEVRFAWETAGVLTDVRRKAALAAAVEAALLAVELTLPRLRLLEEVAEARALLQHKIAAIHPDPEAGGIFAVGHTHIDTAWLWPLRETVRKCGRSFSTACRLMEQYPEFHFTCSQPQLYQYTKTHYPDIYRQIQHWVGTGRWETAGAMWVEADCNVTSGESLIRQMLYGIGFFQQEFGTRPRLCWLPDVFGYPASLPELLAGCGVHAFYTYKLHWQAHNPFPAHLFRWRGLDGSEVTAHVVNHLHAYNNDLRPELLYTGWELYANKTDYPEVIFPFGYGDGGGGVTETQMENYRLAAGQYPGLPAVRIGTAEEFFADVAAADPALPVWDGELYVETHRGTYTTQSAMKRANRQCEVALREAEFWGTLASVTGATQAFTAATLRAAWQDTLTLQFHDILPGSSIGMVYDEALPVLAGVHAQARQVAAAHCAALLPAGEQTQTLCVFNSLSWSRGDVLTAVVPDPGGPFALADPEGNRHPVQVLDRRDGQLTIAFHPGYLSPCGYTVFRLEAPGPSAPSPLTVSARRLENRFYLIELNDAGALTRLYDKEQQREVLAPGAVGNDLQLLQDGPEGEDAWNVHETIDKRRYPFEGETTITLLADGPMQGGVRVRRTHRDSTLEQDIILYAEGRRIDFVTRVDWQARQTMLKVAFPVAIRAKQATYEVQFGAYARPTHRNTSWEAQQFEVPGHRWVDLAETGYGVSLLNDSRYGFDVKEHVMRITLLRSPIFPDPEADRGRHEFTYSLLPHAGTWTEAEIVHRAWELNVPAHVTAGSLPSGTPAARSFLSMSGLPAIVETLKPAEDGRGLILRIYEPHGARGTVRVSLGVPVRQVIACNLVEEDEGVVELDGQRFQCELTPFQIRTFRVLSLATIDHDLTLGTGEQDGQDK
jgi:alpha-mannosidase